VYQEREQTDQTTPTVFHTQYAEDLVLNMSQMRDAMHVQIFHLRSPNLDEDNVVTASAAREVASQKAAQKVSDSAVAAKVPATPLGQPRHLAALQGHPHMPIPGTSVIDFQ
jgi:hypothetical protein